MIFAVNVMCVHTGSIVRAPHHTTPWHGTAHHSTAKQSKTLFRLVSRSPYIQGERTQPVCVACYFEPSLVFVACIGARVAFFPFRAFRCLLLSENHAPNPTNRYWMEVWFLFRSFSVEWIPYFERSRPFCVFSMNRKPLRVVFLCCVCVFFAASPSSFSFQLDSCLAYWFSVWFISCFFFRVYVCVCGEFDLLVSWCCLSVLELCSMLLRIVFHGSMLSPLSLIMKCVFFHLFCRCGMRLFPSLRTISTGWKRLAFHRVSQFVIIRKVKSIEMENCT